MKKTLLFYPAFFIVFSIIFFLLLRSPLFRSQDVLFYRGLGLLGVVVIILGMGGRFGVLGRLGVKIKTETYIAALVLSFSLHLVFFVVFPVTFDRSVTMFLLNKLDLSSQNCAYTEQKLESELIRVYIKDQHAVSRRIKEQLQIGFVKKSGDCIQKTEKTSSFIRFSRFIEILYGMR